MIVLAPKPGPEGCGTCRYFGDLPGLEWGACTRRAPVVADPLCEAHFRGWPRVWNVDNCGDFVRRLDPVLDEAAPAPAPVPDMLDAAYRGA